MENSKFILLQILSPKDKFYLPKNLVQKDIDIGKELEYTNLKENENHYHIESDYYMKRRI